MYVLWGRGGWALLFRIPHQNVWFFLSYLWHGQTFNTIYLVPLLRTMLKALRGPFVDSLIYDDERVTSSLIFSIEHKNDTLFETKMTKSILCFGQNSWKTITLWVAHLYWWNIRMKICNCEEYILHRLRNRKHGPCFCRVIETRVEVLENEKCRGNTSRSQTFTNVSITR